MKISFKAKFIANGVCKDAYRRVSEEKLNDLFLVFLPRRIEILPSDFLHRYPSQGSWYEIKLETDQLFTLEDISEKFLKLGILVQEFTCVKREFTSKELEQIKKLVTFKEVFQPSEVG